jgi:hypothetical protein
MYKDSLSVIPPLRQTTVRATALKAKKAKNDFRGKENGAL